MIIPSMSNVINITETARDTEKAQKFIPEAK